MSIGTVVTGVKNTIDLADGFTITGRDKNVTIGDWKVLDSGTDKAAIVEYRPSDHGQTGLPAGHRKHASHHKFIVHVMRKYKQDGSTYENLLADTGTVLNALNQYPRLNGTTGVVKAVANHTAEPTAMMQDGKGPYFAMLDIQLVVTEEVSANSQE